MVNLSNQLEYGEIKAIVAKTGFHRTTVSKVLNGRGKNAKIIKEALKLINKRKKENSKLENQVKETTK